MDKYEMVKDLGSGNFGVARLMRVKETKELVAMKFIERGQKVYRYICFILGSGMLLLGTKNRWCCAILHFSFSHLHPHPPCVP